MAFAWVVKGGQWPKIAACPPSDGGGTCPMLEASPHNACLPLSVTNQQGLLSNPVLKSGLISGSLSLAGDTLAQLITSQSNSGQVRRGRLLHSWTGQPASWLPRRASAAILTLWLELRPRLACREAAPGMMPLAPPAWAPLASSFTGPTRCGFAGANLISGWAGLAGARGNRPATRRAQPLAPLQFFWYRALDRAFPGRALANFLAKVGSPALHTCGCLCPCCSVESTAVPSALVTPAGAQRFLLCCTRRRRRQGERRQSPFCSLSRASSLCYRLAGALRQVAPSPRLRWRGWLGAWRRGTGASPFPLSWPPGVAQPAGAGPRDHLGGVCVEHGAHRAAGQAACQVRGRLLPHHAQRLEVLGGWA